MLDASASGRSELLRRRKADIVLGVVLGPEPRSRTGSTHLVWIFLLRICGASCLVNQLDDSLYGSSASLEPQPHNIRARFVYKGI